MSLRVRNFATEISIPWFKQPWTFFALTAVFSLSVPGFAAVKALLLFSVWAFLLFQQKRLKPISVLWFVAATSGIIASSAVGLFAGVPLADTLNQAFRTLTLFVVFSAGLLLIHRTDITTRHLDRLIVWIAVLAILLKVSIVIVLLLGWITSDQLQAALGFETVQDNIGFGLLRLQFPSDIILQFLLVCYVGGRRRAVDSLVLLAITVSVLLSFSRYIFIAYAVSLLLRALFVRRLDFLSRVAALIASIAFVIFFASLVNRFSGQGSVASDYTRTEQIREISSSIMQHPFLGTGLGSGVHGYKRSLTIPFSYEVQWYALAMQMGLPGLLLFLLNLLAPPLLILQQNSQRRCFFAVWLLWAASGFTNPFIVSVGSGFGLALLSLRLTRATHYPFRPWSRLSSATQSHSTNLPCNHP